MKYFTPEEATSMLPLIKQITEDIITTGMNMRKLVEKLDGKIENSREFEEGKIKLMGYLEELQELGVYYKDWNFTLGLVDFPAIINGAEVMLCWRSDEDEISYYHGLEDGYAGRQVIPDEYFNK